MSWRYLAQQFSAEGPGELFQLNAPLNGLKIGERLSAPPDATATISTATRELAGPTGEPLFRKWGAAVYAEASGQIQGGWLLRDNTWNGDSWDLDLVGFSGYPQGMPYNGDENFIQVDPLNIYRHIWDHLQDQPGGNLVVQLDDTTSPVRVGTEGEDEAAGEKGPRKLNWWSTHDLGAEIDTLAKETPFDWIESHRWANDGDNEIDHLIRTGYPKIGVRRHDLNGLVYGVNVLTPPPVTEGEYADSVISLGSGEGRDQIRGYAGHTRDRIRRVRVVTDTSMQNASLADSLARDTLAASQGKLLVQTIRVQRHRSLDPMAIGLGDEVFYAAKTPWIKIGQWVRVVSRSYSPEDDAVDLTVVFADSE